MRVWVWVRACVRTHLPVADGIVCLPGLPFGVACFVCVRVRAHVVGECVGICARARACVSVCVCAFGMFLPFSLQSKARESLSSTGKIDRSSSESNSSSMSAMVGRAAGVGPALRCAKRRRVCAPPRLGGSVTRTGGSSTMNTGLDKRLLVN